MLNNAKAKGVLKPWIWVFHLRCGLESVSVGRTLGSTGNVLIAVSPLLVGGKGVVQDVEIGREYFQMK